MIIFTLYLCDRTFYVKKNFKSLLPEFLFFQTGGYYKWTSNWKTRYTKWAAGEPKENSACVYLDLDGTWKTASCNESYFSVCMISDGKQRHVTILKTHS